MVAAPGARGGKEVVASHVPAHRPSEIELEIGDVTMDLADRDRRELRFGVIALFARVNEFVVLSARDPG